MSKIFLANTCGTILKKKRQTKTVHSTNDDWSWQISPYLCWKFRKWFLLYFNFLILTYSGQFTWQGHRKLQWAMSKDELLLSNSPLEAAEPSRNYARVPGYKKRTRKKQRKEKKNQRRRTLYARVRRYQITSTLRLLLRGDPQDEGLWGRDYNHARVSVSWITSTRGLLLRGHTGRIQGRGWIRAEQLCACFVRCFTSSFTRFSELFFSDSECSQASAVVDGMLVKSVK